MDVGSFMMGLLLGTLVVGLWKNYQFERRIKDDSAAQYVISEIQSHLDQLKSDYQEAAEAEEAGYDG